MKPIDYFLRLWARKLATKKRKKAVRIELQNGCCSARFSCENVEMDYCYPIPNGKNYIECAIYKKKGITYDMEKIKFTKRIGMLIDRILCFILLILVYLLSPFVFIGILIWEWKKTLRNK